MGVDVAWFSKKNKGWTGVQRKELSDFIASVKDGRLGREVAQMDGLVCPLLIIEGRPTWSNDGYLMYDRTEWTMAQHMGMLWSVQMKGVWVVGTDSTAETVACIELYSRWLEKRSHTSLDQRPGPVGSWGKPGSQEFQRHLVSGLPGIGPELAARICDAFGRAPFAWSCERHELEQVKGMGKKKVDNVWELLEEVEFV
jgi:ERCC4-type nuclease